MNSAELQRGYGKIQSSCLLNGKEKSYVLKWYCTAKRFACKMKQQKSLRPYLKVNEILIQ